MPESDVDAKTYPLRLEGEFDTKGLFFVAGRIEEGLSRPSAGVLEFVAKDAGLDIEKILGRRMSIAMDGPNDTTRSFPGVCTTIEFLGVDAGNAHYRAEFQSWFWFLNRTRNCRIYQNQSVVDIFETVVRDSGYDGEIVNRLSETYAMREFCVQYRETDGDFVNRLFEEEGVYYFFDADGHKDMLVLADGATAHTDADGISKIPFYPVDIGRRRQMDFISDWMPGRGAASGKCTLRDYNFERPSAYLEVSSMIKTGTHEQNAHEIYDYPGHYSEATEGTRLARIRMEAEAIRHKTAQGAGNASNLAVGRVFSLTNHPRDEENSDYIVTHIVHEFRLTPDDAPPLDVERPLSGDLNVAHAAEGEPPYIATFDAIPKQEQYRHPLHTPWPEISGVHTAVVVGPPGNEIYCDKYGRIHVQFHWDRLGKKDEKSSCPVRCMTPWSGKGWGAIAIPRIGQEVVVTFEEGNPDRPLAIGMVYNDETMPPYGLPDAKNISGMKSRSTMQGNEDTYHELMFDDTKDEELVRFQSEKDYQQIVKNNAEITVGLEKADPGDLTQKIHNDMTETIGGKMTQTITGDTTQTVEEGDYTQTIEQGNVTRTVESGNETHTLNMGNYGLSADAGSVSIEAAQEIKLTVGGSSITIDQSGVQIQGAAQVKVSAPTVQIAGDTLVRVTGLTITLN